jgi:hypothetical protein
MSGAVPFKTAWLDPEHMRLASFMSWWEWDSPPGDAERGPLSPDQDMWRDSSIFRQPGGAPDAA